MLSECTDHLLATAAWERFASGPRFRHHHSQPQAIEHTDTVRTRQIHLQIPRSARILSLLICGVPAGYCKLLAYEGISESGANQTEDLGIGPACVRPLPGDSSQHRSSALDSLSYGYSSSHRLLFLILKLTPGSAISRCE